MPTRCPPSDQNCTTTYTGWKMLLSSGAEDRDAPEWMQIKEIRHSKPIICMTCTVPSGGRPVFYTANAAIHRVVGYSGDPELSIEGNGESVRSVQIGKDGRVAIARGEGVEIWQDQQCVRVLNHPAQVSTMAWLGNTLATAYESVVFVWNSTSWETSNTFQLPSRVQTTAISSDESMLLAHSGHCYYVWDLGESVLIKSGKVATSASLSCGSIGHSRLLLGCSDGQCFSIKVGSNEEVNTLRLWGHTKNVRSVSISKDDSRGVSGSWDCSLRVWCLETGIILRELADMHTAYVTSGCFFGSDHSYVASGSSDSTLRIFDLHSNDRERILALLHRPRSNHASYTHALPVDVMRRIKQMMFGSSQV